MNISGSCLSNEKSITQEGVKHTAAQLKRCPHVNGYSKGYVDMEHLSLTYYRWMESLWHFGLALSKTTYRQRLYLNGHSARPQKQLDRHVNQKLLIKCFFSETCVTRILPVIKSFIWGTNNFYSNTEVASKYSNCLHQTKQSSPLKLILPSSRDFNSFCRLH